MPSISQLVSDNAKRLSQQGDAAVQTATAVVPGTATSVPIVGATVVSRGSPPVGSVLDTDLENASGRGSYAVAPIRSRVFSPATPLWLVKNKVSGGASQGAAQGTQKLVGNVYYNSSGKTVKFFTL